MIEQKAVVVSLKQGYAWVKPLGSQGCGGCSVKLSSCVSAAGVFDFLKPPSEQLYVQNPLRARPGDEVVIGMQSNALVVYSLFAYLLPLLSMLVFAVLGKELFQMMGMHADLGAILMGMAGLFSGLKLAGWLAQNLAKSSGVEPVILRHHEQMIQPVIPISHA